MMKILDKEEFSKVPFGTVYISYVPNCFSGLPKIKSEHRGDGSWWATDLLPWTEFDDTVIEQGIDIETIEFCTDDSLWDYGKDAMFAVFSKREVLRMISVLFEALEQMEG